MPQITSCFDFGYFFLFIKSPYIFFNAHYRIKYCILNRKEIKFAINFVLTNFRIKSKFIKIFIIVCEIIGSMKQVGYLWEIDVDVVILVFYYSNLYTHSSIRCSGQPRRRSKYPYRLSIRWERLSRQPNKLFRTQRRLSKKPIKLPRSLANCKCLHRKTRGFKNADSQFRKPNKPSKHRERLILHIHPKAATWGGKEGKTPTSPSLRDCWHKHVHCTDGLKGKGSSMWSKLSITPKFQNHKVHSWSETPFYTVYKIHVEK